jgi:predicted nucleic acid-binding protein
VPERHPRGLLDASILIALDGLEPSWLPDESAVSAITMAELAAGPHATDDPHERARRFELLQRAESTFDQLPFDEAAARAYGRVCSAVAASGRRAGDGRAIGLLLAAVALASRLPLYTCNPDDFAGIDELRLVAVPAPRRG